MARVRVSKYLNQMQVVEGVTFSTVSYFKGKVEVTARGYKGTTWMCTGTWKNAKARTFAKRLKEFFTKITSTSLMVIKQRAKEILEKVEEVTTSAKEDLEAALAKVQTELNTTRKNAESVAKFVLMAKRYKKMTDEEILTKVEEMLK